MSRNGHDTQRSRVYAWERRARGGSMYAGVLELDACEEFMRAVWMKERGRYGMARKPVPLLQRVHQGQRRALSHYGAISLPRWARNHWVILHELAHELLRNRHRGGAHGPQFVGCLMGLAARHMGLDAHELTVWADESGVRYDTRSVGKLPAHTIPDKVLRALPGTAVEIAVRIGVEQGVAITYRQVRGAALRLIGNGLARWRGKVLVRCSTESDVLGWIQDRRSEGCPA